MAAKRAFSEGEKANSGGTSHSTAAVGDGGAKLSDGEREAQLKSTDGESVSGVSGEGSDAGDGEAKENKKEDEEWEQVGPKNKSTITRQVCSCIYE